MVHGEDGGSKRKGGFADSVCDGVERWINWMSPAPARRSPYLQGNYAPVEERTTVPGNDQLVVEGELPTCLNGEYVRTGPNPKFEPTRDYHWFDGDGMLHGVRIKDGSVTYVNRFVRTSRLEQEEAIGQAKFMKFGDLFGKAGLARVLLHELRKKWKVLDPSKGEGTANTALTFHNKQLLALNEGDIPYVVRVLQDGEFETVGTLSYGRQLNHKFTAHPKLDPETQELFTFGYSSQVPYVQYRIVCKDGKMQPEKPVSITIPEPVMMHDFAITAHYAIFMDLPLVLRPKDLLTTGNLITYDSTKKSRFGILPRYATDEAQIRWFELPPGFIFHTVNAWEEGHEVVLYGCRMDGVDLSNVNPEMNQAGTTRWYPYLYEYRFNLKSGEATQRDMQANVDKPVSFDFPRINERLVGRKSRFAYGASFTDPKHLLGTGIVKVDLSLQSGDEGFLRIASFGEDVFGGEPVFVPRTDNPDALEDDGFLLTFVHDEKADVSKFVVIDAHTMSDQPVASVTLPYRVPYGFHGIFVSEAQLASQEGLTE